MHNVGKKTSEETVELHKNRQADNIPSTAHWSPENTLEIEQANLLATTEKICTQSRYPLLALRIFLHIVCGIDANGQIHISARQMAKRLDAHYDTVTKCLKYLREIGVITIER